MGGRAGAPLLFFPISSGVGHSMPNSILITASHNVRSLKRMLREYVFEVSSDRAIGCVIHNPFSLEMLIGRLRLAALEGR
jgi:hypothetical protein